LSLIALVEHGAGAHSTGRGEAKEEVKRGREEEPFVDGRLSVVVVVVVAE